MSEVSVLKDQLRSLVRHLGGSLELVKLRQSYFDYFGEVFDTRTYGISEKMFFNSINDMFEKSYDPITNFTRLHIRENPNQLVNSKNGFLSSPEKDNSDIYTPENSAVPRQNKFQHTADGLPVENRAGTDLRVRTISKFVYDFGAHSSTGYSMCVLKMQQKFNKIYGFPPWCEFLDPVKFANELSNPDWRRFFTLSQQEEKMEPPCRDKPAYIINVTPEQYSLALSGTVMTPPSSKSRKSENKSDNKREDIREQFYKTVQNVVMAEQVAKAESAKNGLLSGSSSINDKRSSRDQNQSEDLVSKSNLSDFGNIGWPDSSKHSSCVGIKANWNMGHDENTKPENKNIAASKKHHSNNVREFGNIGWPDSWKNSSHVNENWNMDHDKNAKPEKENIATSKKHHSKVVRDRSAKYVIQGSRVDSFGEQIALTDTELKKQSDHNWNIGHDMKTKPEKENDASASRKLHSNDVRDRSTKYVAQQPKADSFGEPIVLTDAELKKLNDDVTERQYDFVHQMIKAEEERMKQTEQWIDETVSLIHGNYVSSSSSSLVGLELHEIDDRIIEFRKRMSILEEKLGKLDDVAAKDVRGCVAQSEAAFLQMVFEDKNFSNKHLRRILYEYGVALQNDHVSWNSEMPPRPTFSSYMPLLKS